MAETSQKKVVTRFAPSPTGDPHIGNVRTAFYAWLFARQHEGEFLIRIEDTDRARSVEGSEEKILKMWKWLGFDYDREIIRQSERKSVYGEIAEKLVENSKAYRCFCAPERLDAMRKEQQARKEQPRYDEHCRNISAEESDERKNNGEEFVIRLITPEGGETVACDIIRGKVEFPNNNIDDLVLLKRDGFPTYHLAHVIDDYEQGVTHVIRSEEWLPSLPKHILIHDALGYELPNYAHLPMILATDKSKLSKRHGAVSVLDFKAQGYLPEAIVNFMLLLGWHPKDGSEQEVFDLDDMKKQFALEDVQKSGAVFDYQKLDWMNAHYIRRMESDLLYDSVLPFFEKNDAYKGLDFLGNNETSELLKRALRLEQDRVKKLSEFPDALGFVFFEPTYDNPDILIWKKSDKAETVDRLEMLAELLNGIVSWNEEEIEKTVKDKIESEGYGNGDTLWPLRVALSGREKSPGPFEIAEVIGKEKTINRINNAIKILG